MSTMHARVDAKKRPASILCSLSFNPLSTLHLEESQSIPHLNFIMRIIHNEALARFIHYDIDLREYVEREQKCIACSSNQKHKTEFIQISDLETTASKVQTFFFDHQRTVHKALIHIKDILS